MFRVITDDESLLECGAVAHHIGVVQGNRPRNTAGVTVHERTGYSHEGFLPETLLKIGPTCNWK